MFRIFVLLIVLSNTLLAQRRLMLGPTLVLPSNSFRSVAAPGAGVATKYDVFISKRMALSFSCDYASFGKVNYESISPPVIETTVKAQSLAEQVGLKFFLRKRDQGFYLVTDAGIQTTWVKYSYLSRPGYAVNETNAAYRFGVGFSSRHLDYGVFWQRFYQRDHDIANYNGYSIINPLRYISIRVAYIF